MFQSVSRQSMAIITRIFCEFVRNISFFFDLVPRSHHHRGRGRRGRRRNCPISRSAAVVVLGGNGGLRRAERGWLQGGLFLQKWGGGRGEEGEMTVVAGVEKERNWKEKGKQP